MSLNAISGDNRLVLSLEGNRPVIVRSAMSRSLPVERHSIVADALANRTLDYLVAAVSQFDSDTIVSWVASSLGGFVRDQALFNVFSATVSSALDSAVYEIGNISPQAAEWLEEIQRKIDLMVSASRLAYQQEHFSLDSVDAKINEVLYRLSERDTITAEHSHSVGLWCLRIAKQMGLTREETLQASRSGLIHDIGKISTPLEILTAPRALDADEWVIMRQHTLEGVKAIEGYSELRDFIPAVRWHHERMDGRGYPDELDGGRIPLSARIVAVADAFNAMVARRPYRKPLSPSVALEELKRHSGAHFDPSIIAAMIEVVTQQSA